jgi:hypothetical protein
VPATMTPPPPLRHGRRCRTACARRWVKICLAERGAYGRGRADQPVSGPRCAGEKQGRRRFAPGVPRQSSLVARQLHRYPR